MIIDIPQAEAARLVPLNAVVQALHVAERPDLFVAAPDPQAVEAHFNDWLAQDHVFALGQEEAGRLTGYGVFEVLERPGDVLTHPHKIGFLCHIVVAPDRQRRGIGLALIDAGRQRLAAAGCTRLRATYHVFNAASAALMARAGLQTTVRMVEGPV